MGDTSASEPDSAVSRAIVPGSSGPCIRLLHLSDIHFRSFDPPRLDVEGAVRARMLEDIDLMVKKHGTMDAVLVVGDIAARGWEEEYKIAAAFLATTCGIVGAPPARVVCVPGNHDIDRRAHNPLHGAVRHELRTVDAALISDRLHEILQDADGASVLLAPLSAYNDFALAFDCDIRGDRLVWGPKTLPLGRREVHIHGITSSWISDHRDSDKREGDRIVAGLFQVASVASTAGAISVTLCHHPLHWLRDGEILRPWLARAHVVLTGHEHAAGVELSGDGRSVAIASGAVNPSRAEDGWIPAYNVIELREVDADTLSVTVHARAWQRDRAEFGEDPDRPAPLSFQLPLGSSPTALPHDEFAATGIVRVPEPAPIGSVERDLLYAVMSAPPDRRRQAARELGLLTGTASGLDADRELLAAAVEQERLSELKEKIFE